MRKIALIALAIISTLLAGCSPEKSFKNMKDRVVLDDDSFAQKYLDAISSRDIETAIELLDPQLHQPDTESNLNEIADFFDPGAPVSMEFIGFNVFSTPEKRRSNLTYQYQFTNSWLLASVVVDTIGDEKHVMGITVNPIPASLGELNAFTFENKGIRHYIMLLGAVVIPIFILFALIVCIRTKMKKKKWLWIIFILLGVGKLGLNWSTGQILFNPFSIYVQLLGTGIIKQGIYAPWIIITSLPLGAILFLLRRKKLMKEPEETEHNQSLDLTRDNAQSVVSDV